MCLNITNKLKVSVTSRDLTVYKILSKKGDDYYSPIYFALWDIGKDQHIEPSDLLSGIEFHRAGVFSVTTGFHAFTQKSTVREKQKMWLGSSHSELCIAEMLIPQGTLIIKGDNHEIVANTMKLIKIL